MASRVFMQRQADDGGTEWLEFVRPIHTVAATRMDEVRPLLERVEAESKAGRYAAGWVSYEAAAAFDCLRTHSGSTRPLAWFSFFEGVVLHTYCPLIEDEPYALGELNASWTERTFGQRVGQIKEWIAMGHSYQVNLTFPLTAAFTGSAESLAARLFAGQQGQHGAYIETDDHAIISASPELFFDWNPPRIRCCPMKGTAARSGLNDAAEIAALKASAKDRAENVMIVDMVRNDLGRIAETGSVQAPNLYSVETYPTLFQMTSDVEAKTSATLPALFDALFPCASVTGAPKVRTMELIRELEDGPRGVYTGSIGYIEPTGHVHFNVAIRTAEIDRRQDVLTYSVGAGIVWDSDPEAEYLECLTKARVLQGAYPGLQLLESLLWEPDAGYFLLEKHLRRLQTAASYFGFPLPPPCLETRLEQATASCSAPQKVRLLYSAEGVTKIEVSPLEVNPGETTWKVAIDSEPINPADIFLQHKTTRRHRYEAACARHPDCSDVLLYNDRGEWTESCRANLALRFGDTWYTPPCSAGLLPGTFRQHLIEQGQLVEKILRKEDLHNADETALINSVRKWIKVKWVA